MTFGNIFKSSFFDMGTLQCVNLPLTTDYRGTDLEKKKFQLITNLKYLIHRYKAWEPLKVAYRGFKSISFVLCNNGTTYDEDIEITLEFPRISFIPFDCLPVDFDNTTCTYIIDEIGGVAELFKIRETSVYSEGKQYGVGFYPAPSIMQDRCRSFREEFSSTFGYKTFIDKSKCIVKHNIPYIKQHTKIAFPTVLFVKDSYIEIPYTITSKHCKDIVQDKLMPNS